MHVDMEEFERFHAAFLGSIYLPKILCQVILFASLFWMKGFRVNIAWTVHMVKWIKKIFEIPFLQEIIEIIIESQRARIVAKRPLSAR